MMQDCDTKIKIRKVAEGLFAQKGFHAVSIREIARHSGVNISMINYYFKTKDNLLTDITDQTEFLSEKVQDVAGLEAGSSAFKMKLYCKGLTDNFFENPNVIFILIQQLSITERSRFSFKRSMFKLREILLKNFSKIINEGIQNGEFRNDVDHKLLMKTVLGTLCAELLENRLLFFLRPSASVRSRLEDLKNGLHFYIFQLLLNTISTKTYTPEQVVSGRIPGDDFEPGF